MRYDYFREQLLRKRISARRILAPTRNFVFPHQDNLRWHGHHAEVQAPRDDLFGTGKTALKVSANKGLATTAAADSYRRHEREDSGNAIRETP
jgi:hypothetical protein